MRSTQPQYFEKLERAEVILAVLTPAFYTSGPCLEEMTQALKHGLKIIPLLFELSPDGKAPWALGQWTAVFEKRTKEVEESNHSEAAEAKLEVITKTKKALGKLNSEPAPPGTMIEQGELLDKLVGTVKSLLPSYEIQRQAIEGVSVEEGQLVRDYMQSLVRGPVDEYWPKVMISYATGTRDLKRGYECDLDGDGCGPGMQYANLLARALDRRGISCFSGLHVAGGQNWRQVSENSYVCFSKINFYQF